ncbi:Fic family protein, partial [bacterium]|nr:Fic family protein [bacterium]
PITEGMIREIHRKLVEGVRGGNGRTSRLLSTLCLYKAGYDFKRLFTISEYYDRDRPTFYKTIQSVRENDMDMTGWLEYFITGLQTQMVEVKERGDQVIRRDVLAQKHNLNGRQTKAIEYILQYNRLTIQDYKVLCPEVNRRSLQRDLKIMIETELLAAEGATNQLVYLLRI